MYKNPTNVHVWQCGVLQSSFKVAQFELNWECPAALDCFRTIAIASLMQFQGPKQSWAAGHRRFTSNRAVSKLHCTVKYVQ